MTQDALDALAQELREALAPGMQLLRRLGRGGMGAVFLARDAVLKRLVAVKVLSPELAHDPTARARFTREAEAAAALNHPHVVPVYQVAELSRSGTSYFVMQFVEGQSLAEAVPEGRVTTEARVRRLVGEVASALAAAHARGLVHRDVKPNNIMLEQESGRALVLDFGISAAIGGEQTGAERLTTQGTIIGTPWYMSPEQAAAEPVSDKSDVYALGAVAFELLTGRPVFEGRSPLAVLAAHMKDPPPPVGSIRANLDPAFAELVDHCLAKDPARRPSAAEIARAILPPVERVVEWPPPGLERLQGRGKPLQRALTFAATLAMLTFGAMVVLPPSIAPCCWETEELAPFWVMLSEVTRRVLRLIIDATDTANLWLYVLPFYMFGAFAATLFTFYTIARLTRPVTRAVESGYPWRVVLRALWDNYPDTAALLNGLGRFAMVGDAERRHLVALRERRALMIVASQLAAFLGPVLWAVGITGGFGTRGGELLPVGEALPPLVLVLAGLVGAWLCERPEARLRRRWRQAPSAPAAARPELIDAWLAAGGHARRVGGRVIPKLAWVLTWFVIACLGFWAVGLLFGPILWPTLPIINNRAEMVTWLRGMRADSLPLVTHQELDSVLARSALSQRTVGAAPPELATRFAALATGREGSPTDSVWVNDTVPAGAFPPLRNSRDVLAVEWAFKHGPRWLPDSLRRNLAADTLWPDLPGWRTLARTGGLPPAWYFRSGFPGVAGAGALPFGHGDRMLDLSRRNLMAGALALDRGDRTTALLRLRENIAVGRRLLASPYGTDFVRGYFVARASARQFAGLAATAVDRSLAAEGAAVTALVERAWVDFSALRGSRAALLFASAAEPLGLRFIGDRDLLPVTRWRLITAILMGACHNPREELFGPDPQRLALLDSARVLASDLLRTDEWVGLHRRTLEMLMTEPAALRRAFRSSPWRPFHWVGLGKLADRSTACNRIRRW